MNKVLEFKPIEMDDEFFDDEEPDEVKEARAKFKLKQHLIDEERRRENERVKKAFNIRPKVTPS